MALFHKYSFKYVLCVSSINSDVFVVLLNLTIGYSWSDGSSLNYLNWGLNQPDNYKGMENCVEMDPSTGRWNDADCYVRRNWICMIKRGNLNG